MSVRRIFFRPGLLAPLLAIIVCATAVAQLPSAKLTAIFPPGGKAGDTVEVTVTGADLDDATTIRFSDPGVSAKPVGDSGGATERKYSVVISSAVAPGIYEARVVGQYGITNPRAFAVGDLPEIVGKSSGAASTPTPLPVGSVANGRCSANAADEYAIELTEGQRVMIECDAHAIDSRLMPIMLLSGPNGRELARSRRGGFMDFTAPAGGVYTLQIHDLLYRGGPDYFYRLTASQSPHIDAVFPPAGLPGSKGKYLLFGRNLPGGSPTDLRGEDGKPMEKLEVQIELPSDATAPPKPDAIALLGSAGAGIDAIAYRLKSDKGISNPVLIGFARAPLVTEREPNDSAEKAQKISPPCEVAGRFYPHGDQDVYTFEAATGDAYWIEIFSERLGEPTSPELLVQKVSTSAKGEEKVSDVQDLGGPDMQPAGRKTGGGAGFPAVSRDVSYHFEAKEAGAYRITVRDLFNESKDNASLVYRLSIHKESPDFRLLATGALIPDVKNNTPGDPNPAAPFLRKGGTIPVRVNVVRQDGFDGAVTVEAQDLPPGVHASTVVVPAGENVGHLLLSADDDAAGWVGTVRIVGKAKIGDEEKSRDARVGAVVWEAVTVANNVVERAQSRLCDGMSLSVSADESEPLAIDVGDGHFEARTNGKLHVPLKVKRRMEMKQPLKFAAAGLSQIKTAKSEATIAPGSDEGAIDIDLAQYKLAPGTYTFYLTAQTQVKYQPADAPAKKSDADDKGEKTEKPDKAKRKKRDAKDAQATFYSAPITLKILPK
ncbi:MAG TPA: hypothetical protein VG326_01275 [Tepidisphaeraceae bacterium]|nr:hypothetical protein [Tepidisphaeraceae bacterium]